MIVDEIYTIRCDKCETKITSLLITDYYHIHDGSLYIVENYSMEYFKQLVRGPLEPPLAIVKL